MKRRERTLSMYKSIDCSDLGSTDDSRSLLKISAGSRNTYPTGEDLLVFWSFICLVRVRTSLPVCLIKAHDQVQVCGGSPETGRKTWRSWVHITKVWWCVWRLIRTHHHLSCDDLAFREAGRLSVRLDEVFKGFSKLSHVGAKVLLCVCAAYLFH